jgi:hypothetical protein
MALERSGALTALAVGDEADIFDEAAEIPCYKAGDGVFNFFVLFVREIGRFMHLFDLVRHVHQMIDAVSGAIRLKALHVASGDKLGMVRHDRSPDG